MDQTTEIQATEDQLLPVDNAAASAVDPSLNANSETGQEEGFEIVLKDDENKPKQDPETNAKFAQRRIERKRQRELEQQAEAVKRGELPESIRVTPELPPQPNYNDFFTDEALEKYGWDNARAQAAFQQATNDWLLKAQDVRSNAVAEQGRKVQSTPSNQRNTSMLHVSTMTQRKSSISLITRIKKTHSCKLFQRR